MISRSFSTFRGDTSAASASFFRDTASCPWAQARYLPKRRARRVIEALPMTSPRPPAARPMVGNSSASRLQLRTPAAASTPCTIDTRPAKSSTRPTIFMVLAPFAEYWGVFVTFLRVLEAVPVRGRDGAGFCWDRPGFCRDTGLRFVSPPNSLASSTTSPAGQATANKIAIMAQEPKSLSSFFGGRRGGSCRVSPSRSS